MTRTLALCILILAATCTGYAAGAQSTARAAEPSTDGATRAPWTPMSSDGDQTSLIEDTFPSDERSAHAFEQ